MSQKQTTKLNKWDGGLNYVQTPTPLNCYRTGKNVRLDEMSIPERRPGTIKKATISISKPILNAMKYYPTGRTAQYIVVADEADGSHSDVFMSSSLSTLAAQSQSMTASAVPYLAVYSMYGTGDLTLEDHLLIVNGTDSKQYDPAGDGWSNMEGSPQSGCTHVCVHGDRAWLFKNNYAYYSNTPAGGTAISWAPSTQYLDFAHEGEIIVGGISFNGDLLVFRRNSIGVLRGKDPNSGVQINGLIKNSGTISMKTVIEATYRGQRAVYYISLRGLEVTNGHTNKLLDKNIELIGLVKSGTLGNICCGLHDNRYLMITYNSSTGSQNDTTLVYDTEREMFVSSDSGYFPNCWFNLSGGSDSGELYFGTSKSIGLLHQFDSGSVDGSATADGTDSYIDVSFKTGELFSNDATQQTRIRKLKIAIDVQAGAIIDATLIGDNGRYQTVYSFQDDREVITWGSFVWGAGWKWGSSIERIIFSWNIPNSFRDPYSYAIQLDLDGSQDKSLKLYQIEVLEQPRAFN